MEYDDIVYVSLANGTTLKLILVGGQLQIEPFSPDQHLVIEVAGSNTIVVSSYVKLVPVKEEP